MHVFISYAKRDTYEIACTICKSLEALPDVTGWMDKSLHYGAEWPRQIQDEIIKCDVVVVLLSPDVNREVTPTQQRSFVLNEIDFARDRHKTIIPVMVQATDVPIQLAGIHYFDLTLQPEVGLQELVEDIRRRSIPGEAYEPDNLPEPALPVQRNLNPFVFVGIGTLSTAAALILLLPLVPLTLDRRVVMVGSLLPMILFAFLTSALYIGLRQRLNTKGQRIVHTRRRYLVALASSIVLGVGAWAAGSLRFFPPSAVALSILPSQPQISDSEVVVTEGTLEITVTSSPADARVWILVHPRNSDRWWVQEQPRKFEVDTTLDGAVWRGEIILGTATRGIGESYEVIAVASRDPYVFDYLANRVIQPETELFRLPVLSRSDTLLIRRTN